MRETIKRVKNKTSDYTVMLNEVFRRTDISARAKGLYAYIMTLPDDWRLYKGSLHKHFTEGRDAINSAFNELEKLGYIAKEPNRVEGGKVSGWVYTIYETTEKDTDLLENRQTVSPYTVNPHVLSTDSSRSTNETRFTRFLEKWNEQGLIKHSEKVVSAKWQKRHDSQVKLYGEEITLKAIENYAAVVKSDSHYFSHRWNLWDFIVRGLDNFIDKADPFTNYRKDKKTADSNPYDGLNL